MPNLCYIFITKNRMHKILIRDLTSLLLFLVALISLKDSITPIFLGLVLAYLCGPLAKFFKQFLPCSLASLASIIVVYTCLITIFWTLLISQDFILLQKKFEKILLNAFGLFLNDHLVQVKKILFTKLEENLQNFATAILSSTQSFFNLASNLIFTPFIAFYFLEEIYLRNNKVKGNLGIILKYLDQLAKNFCHIQVSLAFIYAIVLMSFLSIIKLDNALGLGFLYGLGYLIPYLGFIFVTSLVAFFTFLQYGLEYQFLLVLIFSVALNLLDSFFINPNFVAPRFGLSPLSGLISLIITGKVLGLFGMIFAIPIGVIAKDSIKLFWSWGETVKTLQSNKEK